MSRSLLSKVLLLFALLSVPQSLSRARATTAENGPDADVKQFQFGELGARLRTMTSGPERDYFAGLLANAENHIAESIQLLAGVLPSLRRSRLDRAAMALETLADDYTKSFEYAEAARTDDDLLINFSSQLTPEKLKGTKDDAEVMRILHDAPPQTITWTGPLRLKTQRNPLNSQNVELTVNGVQGPWLLDTGANLSVVSESFAERLELKLLPGVAHTQAGLTGIENPLHVALLPTLQMGGATLRNVVVMVVPDANLNIHLGKSSYQINGIVGAPVLQALGTITFVHDGGFEAGVTSRPKGTGARMYMKGLTPIVVCDVEGNHLPFALDTGASNTNLFVRYFDLFRSESKAWKKGKERSSGAGGVVKRKVYIQPEVKIGIGDKTVVLKNISIYKSGTGTDTDGLFGNLGEDIPMNFDRFTLDFTNMTFSLGQSLPPAATTGLLFISPSAANGF